jgi:hypothetical protein
MMPYTCLTHLMGWGEPITMYKVLLLEEMENANNGVQLSLTAN